MPYFLPNLMMEPVTLYPSEMAFLKAMELAQIHVNKLEAAKKKKKPAPKKDRRTRPSREKKKPPKKKEVK